MPRIIARNTFVLLALGFTLSVTDLSAQSRADEPSVGGSSQKSGKTRSYKKARVLQTKTAKKIAKVTEALEIVKIVQVKDTNKESETYGQMIDAEEPNPDMVTVKKILDEMISQEADMKSYDRSVMYNFVAVSYTHLTLPTIYSV